MLKADKGGSGRVGRLRSDALILLSANSDSVVALRSLPKEPLFLSRHAGYHVIGHGLMPSIAMMGTATPTKRSVGMEDQNGCDPSRALEVSHCKLPVSFP